MLDVITNKHRFGMSHICQEPIFTAKSEFLQPRHMPGKQRELITGTLADTDVEGAATITDYPNERSDLNLDLY